MSYVPAGGHTQGSPMFSPVLFKNNFVLRQPSRVQLQFRNMNKSRSEITEKAQQTTTCFHLHTVKFLY